MHLDDAISLVWLDMRVQDPQNADTPTDAVRWTRNTLRPDEVDGAGDDELGEARWRVLDATDDEIADALTDYGTDECDGA